MLGFLFQGSSKSGGESTDSGSAVNTLSSKADLAEAQLEPESPISKKASSSDHQAFDQKHLQQFQQQQLHQEMASDTSRTGTSQNQSAAGKAPMDKVLKLQCLTVNLPVLSLTISPKLGKKLVSLLLLLLFCSLSFFFLSLSPSSISSYTTAQIPTTLRKSIKFRVSLISERFSDECLTWSERNRERKREVYCSHKKKQRENLHSSYHCFSLYCWPTLVLYSILITPPNKNFMFFYP